MRPHGSPETLEKRRLRAISLLRGGLGPGDIARRVGADRRSVHRWLAAYRVGGIDSLAPTPASGRPPRLTPTERKKLERFLLQGASSFGYPNDLWTCPRVAAVIRRRFRVTYHVDHIGRLLRSLGFSPQRPERRARERDEEAIRGWVKTDWPRVKKTSGG